MPTALRKPAPLPAPPSQADDEGSAIRTLGVTGSVRAIGRWSTHSAPGSLDDRLEQKARKAGQLVQALPATDARVRLFYVAIVRRDELLLDGVLADLSTSATVA